MDPERANELLRFAIAVLQGRMMKATPKGQLEVALILKKELASMGAWWQVLRLENWIHRAQGGKFHGS